MEILNSSVMDIPLLDVIELPSFLNAVCFRKVDMDLTKIMMMMKLRQARFKWYLKFLQ